MDVRLKAGGREYSADQIMEVETKQKRIVITIESVKASWLKDAGMLATIIAAWAVLAAAGAQPGFWMGVVVTLLALLVPGSLIKRRGLWRSVEPDDAIEFIEMELEDALSQAKAKGDLV